MAESLIKPRRHTPKWKEATASFLLHIKNNSVNRTTTQ
jgi:hypothetical protein